MAEFSIALLLWSAAESETATRTYRDVTEQAPDEAGGGVLYMTGPPEEFVPPDMVGTLCCGALVAPVLALEPRGQVITDIPYAELQCMLDGPPGYRNYWSAEYLRVLPDEAVRRICAGAERMVVSSPSQHAMIPWGGAVARNGSGWPMANRDVPSVAHPLGLWEDPADDERAREWAHVFNLWHNIVPATA